MKIHIIGLDKLKLEQIGIIEQIKCDKDTKRRLLDMGLVKGTSIIPILQSPSKDPRAFQVRGTIIAIREEDTKKIEVRI